MYGVPRNTEVIKVRPNATELFREAPELQAGSPPYRPNSLRQAAWFTNQDKGGLWGNRGGATGEALGSALRRTELHGRQAASHFEPRPLSPGRALIDVATTPVPECSARDMAWGTQTISKPKTSELTTGV